MRPPPLPLLLLPGCFALRLAAEEDDEEDDDAVARCERRGCGVAPPPTNSGVGACLTPPELLPLPTAALPLAEGAAPVQAREVRVCGGEVL